MNDFEKKVMEKMVAKGFTNVKSVESFGANIDGTIHHVSFNMGGDVDFEVVAAMAKFFGTRNITMVTETTHNCPCCPDNFSSKIVVNIWNPTKNQM